MNLWGVLKAEPNLYCTFTGRALAVVINTKILGLSSVVTNDGSHSCLFSLQMIAITF